MEQNRRTITDALVDEAERLRRDEGLSLRELGERLGVSHMTLYKRLRARGTDLSQRCEKREMTKDLIAAYQSGATIGWVARELAVSWYEAKDRLLAAGVELRKLRAPRKPRVKLVMTGKCRRCEIILEAVGDDPSRELCSACEEELEILAGKREPQRWVEIPAAMARLTNGW